MSVVTLAPAAASPDVPDWFAPEHREDPLFAVTVSLSMHEMAVAVLASGEHIPANPDQLTLGEAFGIVLAGVRRLGVAEVKYVHARRHEIDAAYLDALRPFMVKNVAPNIPETLAADREHSRALAAVRGGLLRSERRYDHALGVADYIFTCGIHHGQGEYFQRTGRCLARGWCRRCYPQHVAVVTVAR